MQVSCDHSSGAGAVTGQHLRASAVTSGDASSSGLPALGGTGRPLGIREPGHAAADNPALSSLREELGDAAVARFVGRYLSLLDQRITRIGRSIAEQRLQPGVTVLLTLETTSQMVGALQLSACATALRTALQRQGADVTALYDALVAAGAATRSQLART